MEDNPFGRVAAHWEQVVEDMSVTAERYREAGRETVELHPGDVTTLTPSSEEPSLVADADANLDAETPAGPDEYGFDALVPGGEFETVRTLVADHAFGSYEVFRAEADDVVFAVVAVESDDGAAAVLVPVYYDRSALSDLRAAAREQGGLVTRLRPLAGEAVVTFTHEDPTPFFPGETA